MRRSGPRMLRGALEGVAGELRPQGLLAPVQSAWPEVVGEAIAAESEPASERDGVVTVACSSAGWAHELELLGPELLGRLDEALRKRPGTVRTLRFVVRSGAGRPSP